MQQTWFLAVDSHRMFAVLRSFRPTLLVAALLATSPAFAAGVERGPERPTVNDQDAISLRGIFDFQLPKILRPEALRFTLNPQFGDLIHKSSVRVRAGARYAFSEHLEGYAEVLPYCDNFGGDGPGGSGIAEYRFGAKYAWPALFAPFVDTAVGATVSLPSPGAPEDLTIGTTRCLPYVAFSHDWTRVGGLNSFLNIGCEIFDSDPAPGRIARYRPAQDNLVVTPGVVLHRAPWHYTLAASVRTTSPFGGDREYYSILPSVSYEVPPRLLLNMPGRWVAGLGYEAIFFGGDTEHRITGRLRWDYDWKRAARDLGRNVRGYFGLSGRAEPRE